MALVYTKTPGGLVVASHGSDEAVCAAALRGHDPDLRLVAQDTDTYGRRVYKVYRYAGSERPAEFVCGWWDEFGNPYDGLSVTGLLDMVQRHDRNLRGAIPDPDVANDRLREQKRRDFEADVDELVGEYEPYMLDKKRSPLHRGKSLQAARNRVRARTKSRELRP